MKYRIFVTGWLFSFFCFALITSAQEVDQATKDQIIENMIEGGSQTEVAPPFKDIRVVRDGDNDGVLFEYTYEPGVEVDETQLKSRKIIMRLLDEKALSSEQWKEYEEVFGSGVYSRFVYKYSNGSVISDTKITRKVFNDFAEEADELNEIVDNMIDGGKSELDGNDFGGVFKSVDVYREPGFGVVFEYVYSPGLEINEGMLEESKIREQIIDSYKGDEQGWNEMYEILSKGIYMKFVYKRSDDSVISATVVAQQHVEDH